MCPVSVSSVKTCTPNFEDSVYKNTTDHDNNELLISREDALILKNVLLKKLTKKSWANATQRFNRDRVLHAMKAMMTNMMDQMKQMNDKK